MKKENQFQRKSVHMVSSSIYSDDTLKIVALMHDIGKTNSFYYLHEKY